MLGAALLCAALPPLNLWPLAWIAPVFWILLVRAEKLPPYVRLSSLTRAPPPVRLESLTYPAASGCRCWQRHCFSRAEMLVTDWFHSRKFQLYWTSELIFWPALFALVCWAARRWAAHPYRCLWLAGMFFWLADLHWLRLPYWAIGFGWLALGVYFGLYLPVFVGLSRVGVHRLRLPVILVAPAAWTGLQLAQAHLLSGMTMGCLEHTQYRWTGLIQISDLTGSYGVTFLMMFVAACIARSLPSPSGRAAGGEGGPWRWALWPILPATGVLAAVLAYGHWRMSKVPVQPGLKIALIQGDFDVQLPNPEGFRQATQDAYRRLTREALAKHPQADLIVWPETMFTCINPADGDCATWITGDDDADIPPEFPHVSPGEFHERLDNWKQGTRELMTQAAVEFGRPMIVGVERQNFGRRNMAIYNTAVLLTPDGRWFHQPPARYFYDKSHLVPFGEYMPFACLLPWLQYISPLGSGTSSSDRPACFFVKNVCLVPNICYESTLPHVIREQLAALRQDGVEPQVLVNLTNDGWFWGSSELRCTWPAAYTAPSKTAARW